MTQLRLFMFAACERDCPLCCNKTWDFSTVPMCKHYQYDRIMLTGGEPMLRPKMITEAIKEIRKESKAEIFMYTSKVDCPADVMRVLNLLDGLTLTIHDQDEVKDYLDLRRAMGNHYASKRLYLKLFKGVVLPPGSTDGWVVKSNIEWLEDCKLPDGEELQFYDGPAKSNREDFRDKRSHSKREPDARPDRSEGHPQSSLVG